MEAVRNPTQKERRGRPPRTGPPGLRLTEESLEEYLSSLQQKGCVAGTLAVYRRNIFAFYAMLSESKTVQPGDLARWRQELCFYARQNEITSGPLFCTRRGTPLGRTAVTDGIKWLCREARVPEGKANPRCLKRLWQSTQDGIRAQIDLLTEQACDRLMENEQLIVGWDMGKGGDL